MPPPTTTGGGSSKTLAILAATALVACCCAGLAYYLYSTPAKPRRLTKAEKRALKYEKAKQVREGWGWDRSYMYAQMPVSMGGSICYHKI